ncbi:hypothetical protein TIFTF001_036803 [Ficus carica]|uniref:Uncharacterized protein n=1 Tax=Ficus carica TaxID=3494 RepID=A0AA88E434_FICCA|nr:hypothetical protein TIFTF001_036792 [Ficus carica]GMN67737.1 hypothetical protein TIFTF001_036803 [Ficus carica]
MVFGIAVHLQCPFEPLYSNPNLVYCSSNLPCPSVSPVPGSCARISRLHSGVHVLVSVGLLAVPPSHRASAFVPGALVCGRPSSLLAEFKR